MKQNIETFVRLRPSNRGAPKYYAVDPLDNTLNFKIPKNEGNAIGNQREEYGFTFTKIFDVDTKQDEIFEVVARKACLNVIEGYNSTIFAYGQTGSGKTFTITGGPDRYEDRGIIPRSLSYLFSEFQKRPETQYTVHISYLEIYNETGYDLLRQDRVASRLEDLPEVKLRENEMGDIEMQGLTGHVASNEEDALNLLFLGDTCRMIAETPQNEASSRSHCIFTVNIEARQDGSDMVRRSKLHLVDLAGSERVSRTGARDNLLREAKYINLSLHYLELVILALHDSMTKNRQQFVPYRNSMMTSVLRDSLGGNCRTIMIANIHSDHRYSDESVSTCRFAQRVSTISNTAVINEEVNPDLVIKRLKRQVQELKEEIALNSGDDPDRILTESELAKLRAMVVAFIEDRSPEAHLPVSDMLSIRECFNILKNFVLESRGGRPLTATSGQLPASPTAGAGARDRDALAKANAIIQQRDMEIGVLLRKVEKMKAEGAGAGQRPVRDAYTQTASQDPRRSSSSQGPRLSQERTHWMVEQALPKDEGRPRASQPNSPQGASVLPQLPSSPTARGNTAPRAPAAPVRPPSIEEATAMFRAQYGPWKWIEENNETLQRKYDEAKALGESVMNSKNKINALKALIEQLRVERAVQGLNTEASVDDPTGADEERNKVLIEREKTRYKEEFMKMRELRVEIEHLQLLLEKNHLKMQQDFEVYYRGLIESSQQAGQQGGSPHAPHSARDVSRDTPRSSTLSGSERETTVTLSNPPSARGSRALDSARDTESSVRSSRAGSVSRETPREAPPLRGAPTPRSLGVSAANSDAYDQPGQSRVAPARMNGDYETQQASMRGVSTTRTTTTTSSGDGYDVRGGYRDLAESGGRSRTNADRAAASAATAAPPAEAYDAARREREREREYRDRERDSGRERDYRDAEHRRMAPTSPTRNGASTDFTLPSPAPARILPEMRNDRAAPGGARATDYARRRDADDHLAWPSAGSQAWTAPNEAPRLGESPTPRDRARSPPQRVSLSRGGSRGGGYATSEIERTGNAAVDADILAYQKARDSVMRNGR